jgi:hypothetical protein
MQVSLGLPAGERLQRPLFPKYRFRNRVGSGAWTCLGARSGYTSTTDHLHGQRVRQGDRDQREWPQGGDLERGMWTCGPSAHGGRALLEKQDRPVLRKAVLSSRTVQVD